MTKRFPNFDQKLGCGLKEIESSIVSGVLSKKLEYNESVWKIFIKSNMKIANNMGWLLVKIFLKNTTQSIQFRKNS